MSAGLSIVTGFFTSAAAGILAALLLLPFQEMRRFFFALNAGLAFGLLSLAAPYRSAISPGALKASAQIDAEAGRAAGLAALAMALVIVYLVALYLPGGRQGTWILALAATAALLAAATDGWRAGRGTGGRWIFALDALAAAALLGSVMVAMILGHWYLVRSRLPVSHLVRFSRIIAVVVGVRAFLCGAGLLIIGARSSLGLSGYLADLAVHRGFFFWQRVFFGILAPAVFAYMVHETARIRSTQSATGILYIAVIFVFIGEFLARYLTIAGVGPM